MRQPTEAECLEEGRLLNVLTGLREALRLAKITENMDQECKVLVQRNSTLHKLSMLYLSRSEEPVCNA